MVKFEAIRRCHFHPSKVWGQIFSFLEYGVLQKPSNPSIYTVQWGPLSQTLGVNSHAESV